MEFIYLFLFRALSGAQNGAGYAKNNSLRIVIGILLALLAVLPIVAMQAGWMVVNDWFAIIVVVAGSIASAVGVLGVEDGFNEQFGLLPKDIHLWEILATGGVLIAVVALNGNLLLIIAHVYPALILHKAFVNFGSGKSFWYHGTDDATGKTFAIPLLNMKVPRMGLRGRQVLAALSLLLAAATWYMGWHIDIVQIFEATIFS